MRKNKKLFAILTLVAFMMTLMPVLAFGAVTGGSAVAKANVTFAAGTNGAYNINATVTAANYAAIYEVGADGTTLGSEVGTEFTGGGTDTTATFTNVTLDANKNYVVIEDAATVNASGTLADNSNNFTKTDADEAIKGITSGAIVNISGVPTVDATGISAFAAAGDVYKLDANFEITGSKLTLPVVPVEDDVYLAVTADTNLGGKTLVKTADRTNLYTVTAANVTTYNNARAQLATNQKTADALVAAIQNPTQANLDQFRGLYAAGDAGQDAAIATLVNAATAVDGFDFTAVIAADVTYLSNTGTTPSAAESYLKAKNIITSGSIPAPVTPGSGVPSAARSVISTVNSNESINTSGASSDNIAHIQIVMNNASNQRINPSSPQDVYVWVSESGVASNIPSDAFRLYTNSNATGEVAFHSALNTDALQAQYGRVYKLTGITSNVTDLYVQFQRGGTYTLKASFVDPYDTTNKVIVNNPQTLQNDTNKGSIVATSPAANTRLWFITGQYALDNGSVYNTIATSKANNVLEDGDTSTGAVTLQANNVTTTKVELTLYNQSGGTVSNYPIKLSTNSANIELSDATVTTGNLGTATFNVAGVREGTYKIYVTIGDYESVLLVQVGATAATDLTLTKFPSNPIATDTLVTDYKDIFRIVLTDAAGNVVTAAYPEGADRATNDGTLRAISNEDAKYVSIVTAPEANKVKDVDVVLYKVPNKDYYTLRVLNNKSFQAEGKYEVKVVLNNGRSVTIPFEVKKFDKAVSLTIEYPTEAVELNAYTDAPDIYFTDANGVIKKANNRVTVAATGYAVASVNVNQLGQSETGVVKVKNDEKYLGSTITVSAVAEKENLMDTTTLSVTDSAQTIKLDSNRGQVNANNRIGFKLVNSNGQAVALGNDTTIDDVTAIVTNTGDPDAKVSFSISGSTRSDLQSNGTGVINLSSNKQTTATVQIMIKVTKKVNTDTQQDNNTGLSTTYYTGTETFTFGAEADKSVVMTIGSKEIVAQNVPVTIDVAPFIQDNRTYVPFRALVEAFGAEVDYNADNNTVTTKLDGKTVVLTVGSTVLTVNDETVTMDVAPFIVDDRVVVPVRFVGEAFGFTVEATQDADTGATASVVFYQK